MPNKAFSGGVIDYEECRLAQISNSITATAASVASAMGSMIKLAAEKKYEDRIPGMIFDENSYGIGISKNAGMRPPMSTESGIAQYLKEYMYNELAFFPDKVGISVDVFPTDEMPAGANSQQELAVINGTGTVNITYGGAMIQLPFMIQDRDILPFDAIQLGSERAVYTRENIRNILLNLKNKVDSQAQGASAYSQMSSSLNPFVGVDTQLTKNPLVDVGFMSEMLNIQRTLGTRGNGGTNLGIYASSKSLIDYLLEKTADITRIEFSSEDFRSLEKDLLPGAEKLAATAWVEDDEEKKLHKRASDALGEIVLADVRILKNGTPFMFIENQNREISNVPGFVYDCVVDAAGPTSRRLVVAADGRYQLLRPGDKFMFKVNSDTPVVKLHKTTIEGLNTGDQFTLSVNGLHSVPMTVTNVISGSPKGLNVSRFVYALDTDGNEAVIIPLSNISDNSIVYNHKSRIIKEVAKIELPTKLTAYNMYLKADVPVICVSDNASFTKLVPGLIYNLKSTTELEFITEDIMKLAGSGDIIHISRAGKGKYSLVVTWYDSKYHKNQSVTLNNIDDSKVMGAMKIVGFSPDVIRSSMTSLTSRDVEIPLPQRHSAWTLKPERGALETAKKVIGDAKKALFDKNVAMKMVGNVGAGLVRNFAGDDIISSLSAFASESKNLAITFEKLASKYDNDTLLEIAGLMTIKHRVDDMLKVAVSEDGMFDGTVCLSELKKLEPCLVKHAGSLIELKVKQASCYNDIISPVIIAATLHHLDNLHKYSREF